MALTKYYSRLGKYFIDLWKYHPSQGNTDDGVDLGDVVGCDMPSQHDISY